MFSLRTHAIICACLSATLIGLIILGNLLQGAGMKPPEGWASIIALSLFFALFVAAGMSAIPRDVEGGLARSGTLGQPERAGDRRHGSTSGGNRLGALGRHRR